MSGRNDTQKDNNKSSKSSKQNSGENTTSSKSKKKRDAEIAAESVEAIVEAEAPELVEAEKDDDDEEIPKHVMNRLMSLKMLHEEKSAIDEEYLRKKVDLEKEHLEKLTPIFVKRRDIASGAVSVDIEFTRAEEGSSDKPTSGAALVVANDVGSPIVNASVVTRARDADNEDDNGIPQFWLESIVHHSSISEIIVDDDVGALKHLTDVTFVLTFPKPNEQDSCHNDDCHDDDCEECDPNIPSGYQLQFHFSENEYFTDSILTKQYQVKGIIGRESDMVLIDITGCQIHWKQDKNLTIKTISRKKRAKGSGKRGNSTQIIQRIVKKESFFNFFSPPSMEALKVKAEEAGGVKANDDDDDENENDHKKKTKNSKSNKKANRSDTEDSTAEEDDVVALENKVDADFEIGESFRLDLIPNAILWFTGEAMEDDDDMDGLDDEDMLLNEDDDEEEEEEAPIVVGKKGKGGAGRGSGASSGRKGAAADGGEKPECKQS